MANDMAVIPEVWPVAADRVGIWLISGDDAWRSGAVQSDSDPHAEVELELRIRGVREHLALMHSTSWRTDGPRLIVTYMAVITADDLVPGLWPNARPVTLDLLAAVGKPPGHAPDEAPAPRYVDVLMHGLRHLRWLADPANDATSAAAFPACWHGHLAPLEPALATMYDEAHQAAG